jgi:3-deoxy-manno-octulosonate cytidylyltransferase (CMP-KDO synthetase)
MKFIGIIPARYASTRFPGKPLADLCGKTVIQRVYEQASKKLDVVIVATDDQRIYDCVHSFGGEVVMTSPHHTCGTDRVYEAFQYYYDSLDNTCALEDIVVVNIQGDEPFIQPDQIQSLMDCFPTEIATLVHPFTEKDTWQDLVNPNYVKVAIARECDTTNITTMGRAIYFSRSVIPYLRGVEQGEWLHRGQFFSHIGLYAYRADVLMRITQMPQTPLEISESLEQLRWLENGLKIKVAISNTKSIGIDTPEDLQQAIEYFNILNK